MRSGFQAYHVADILQNAEMEIAAVRLVPKVGNAAALSSEPAIIKTGILHLPKLYCDWAVGHSKIVLL